MVNSKRRRKGRVARLPDGLKWWIPRPGVEMTGTVVRLETVRDPWGRGPHPVIVFWPDGALGPVAITDCIRARSIAQTVQPGARLLVTYHGWQPGRDGRMMRDIRIHVGRQPGGE